jgi:hypothetical protein
MPEIEINEEASPEEMVDQHEIGRALLHRLFGTLGVGRAVVVDDDYELGVDEDRLLELLLSLEVEHGEDPFQIIGVDLAGSDDRVDALRQQIRSWDEEARLAHLRVLKERYFDLPSAPMFADTIASLTDGNCELVQLSPRRWQAERGRLIAEAENGEKRGENRTLFLFDLDLGGKDPRGLDGRQLLDELRGDIPRSSLLCGILSGMYRKEDEANEAAKGGLANPPVYLSKDRLDQEPESFAYGVRRTAMVEIVANVMTTAIDVLRGAHGQAERDLRQLNVNDFERVVLQISQQEGIWEADTVFRIYNIYHRKAARMLAKADGQLDRALEKMRVVGGIGSEVPSDEAEPLQLKQIQALEMYELADDVNRHFLPIELGDIFAVGNDNDAPLYILLGQPCDLSLRPKPDAAGNLGGERRLTSPWLVKLTAYGKGGPPRNAISGHYPLPYITTEFGPLWAAFRTAKPVSLDILDLCAFDRNGSASIDVANGPHPDLLPAWTGRYTELQSIYAAEIERRRESENFLGSLHQPEKTPTSIRNHLLRMPGAPFDIVGDPTIAQTRVSFHCKRVRRLVQPHAGVLLIKLAHYLSREAFDVDLARKL